MNELTFKDSKSMCYKVVTDSSGKKYLMDISTLTPKFFGFGFLPKRARVEMVEIDKKSHLFDKKTEENGAVLVRAGAMGCSPILAVSIMKLLDGSLDSHF